MLHPSVELRRRRAADPYSKLAQDGTTKILENYSFESILQPGRFIFLLVTTAFRSAVVSLWFLPVSRFHFTTTTQRHDEDFRGLAV